jgi:hypothetical protein
LLVTIDFVNLTLISNENCNKVEGKNKRYKNRRIIQLRTNVNSNPTKMERCKLCNKEKKLMESHIIPKFVYRWMKQTGTGRLRQGLLVNKPIQDGKKEVLLCQDCEQEFCKREDWFKKYVFISFINNRNTTFYPSDNLKYFAISLLWRVLIYFKDDGNKYKFKDKLDEAEIEWRKYLYENENLIKYDTIHLICNSDEIKIIDAPNRIYSYLLRAVDIEIGESDRKCFIYAKFARFIFIGVIEGFENSSFIETDMPQSINSTFQGINDSDLLCFIINRAENTKGFQDLSLEQREKNKEYFKTRIDQIKGNDYWNQFLKDNKKIKPLKHV